MTGMNVGLPAFLERGRSLLRLLYKTCEALKLDIPQVELVLALTRIELCENKLEP